MNKFKYSDETIEMVYKHFPDYTSAIKLLNQNRIISLRNYSSFSIRITVNYKRS